MRSKAPRVSVLFSALALMLGLFGACTVSDEPSVGAAGSERGPCYNNKTWDAGLTCLSDVCVAIAGGGGEAGSASDEAGTSGSSAGPTGGAPDGKGGGAPGGAGSGGEGDSLHGTEGGVGGAPEPEPPTASGLRLSWSLQGADTTHGLSCAEAGGSTVAVTVTRSGSDPVVQEDLFDCGQGTGDALYEFGDYTISVQLLNGQNLALGSTPSFHLSADDVMCAEVVDGHCLKAIAVVIAVDGA